MKYLGMKIKVNQLKLTPSQPYKLIGKNIEDKNDWFIFYIKIYTYFILINFISFIKNIIKKIFIYKIYKKNNEKKIIFIILII